MNFWDYASAHSVDAVTMVAAIAIAVAVIGSAIARRVT